MPRHLQPIYLHTSPIPTVPMQMSMTRDVILQLQRISGYQSRMRDLKNKLAAFGEVLARQESAFAELRLVTRCAVCPQLLFTHPSNLLETLRVMVCSSLDPRPDVRKVNRIVRCLPTMMAMLLTSARNPYAHSVAYVHSRLLVSCRFCNGLACLSCLCCRLPAAYRALLSEAVRRRAWQDTFAAQAARVAEHMSRARDKEVQRRAAFMAQVKESTCLVHGLKPMNHNFRSRIPAFA